MCCFTQPIEFVGNTSIFARGADGRQLLVYSMAYSAAAELAMVLPLPVPKHAPEDAVHFISLKDYPAFFDDMRRGFLPRMEVRFSSEATLSLAPARLAVHQVGSFEASFVPRIEDFERLDPRFRVPGDVWDKLPGYRDYGFAVFKLAAASRGQVHPMAFSFPRRSTDLLFFPTVHVHDGEVHPQAAFDHMLYCQADTRIDEHLDGWEQSREPASGFLDTARTEGIVEPDAPCWSRPLEGVLKNEDASLGKGGALPAPWVLFRIRYRDPGGACSFAAVQSKVLIGRGTGCDVLVAGASLSRQHAKLAVEDGRVWLYAMATKRGTRLNGTLVVGTPFGRAPLSDGDNFTCGDVEFSLEVVNLR